MAPGQVDSYDPESGSTQLLQTSAIPAPSGVLCLGCDLFGTSVYAGLVDGSPKKHSGDLNDSSAWVADRSAPSGAGACETLAVIEAGNTNGTTFAQFSTGTSDHFLYRSDADSTTWTKMGRADPQLITACAVDGNLFGCTATQLYCRETSPVDLVWRVIGNSPATNIYSMAGYYGRLFALCGTRGGAASVYWRAAYADTGRNFTSPSLLFYGAGGAGMASIGTLAGNGDFLQTGTAYVGTEYTHITRANNGMVFFYKQTDGSAKLSRFAANGTETVVTTWSPGSFGNWSSVVYVYTGIDEPGASTNEKVLFYNSGSSSAYIGRFDTTDGHFISEYFSSAFTTGWTLITATHQGGLFFYNGNAGTYAFGHVLNNGTYVNDGNGSGLGTGWSQAVAAGNTYIFLYQQTGTVALIELFGGTYRLSAQWGLGTFGGGWTLAGAASVLFYGATNGNAAVFGVREADYLTLRLYDAGALSSGATIVAPLGVL